MIESKRKAGTNKTGSRIIAGIAASVLTTIMMTAVCVLLMDRDMLGVNTQPTAAGVIVFVSVLAGCVIACRQGGGAVGAVLTGSAYLGMTALVTVVLFDGRFCSVPLGVLTVICGVAAGILANMWKQKRSGRLKRRRRYC